jgi:drug/metabolite transporter (DMT)-like permease
LLIYKNLNERYKGIILAAIAATLWSTGGLLIKLIDWNPIAIAGSRSFIAAIVLLIYVRKPKFTKSKPQILGAITYTITVICFVIANKLTTAANVILLQYTAPIFVAILGAWLLKERIKGIDIFAIIAVFMGMILFFIQNINPGNTLGNLLAVLTGFFLACTTVALRFQKDGSAIDCTLLGNILSFIIALPFILQVSFDIKSIVYMIVLGVFQIGISYIFYVNSLRYITALEAILVTVLEPLLNPLWVFIFTGESPGLFSILGGLIIISAIIGRGIYISKKESIKESC